MKKIFSISAILLFSMGILLPLEDNAFAAVSCPSNMYFNTSNNTCACYAGTYFVSGSAGCAYCPAGQILSGSTCKPVTCPANMYYNTSNNTCACYAGSYYVSPSAGCAYCPAGQILSGSTCKPVTCPANMYYNTSNNTCACYAGSYYVSPSAGCAYCPAGQILNGNTCQAITCPANMYYNTSNNTCACYAGSHYVSGSAGCAYAYTAPNCTSKCIGMEYEVIYPNVTPWGPRWGTPLLGLYNSTSPAIIDQHAQWFNDLGVNFLIIDWSNVSQNYVAGAVYVKTNTLADTDALFAEYQNLSQQGKPYPRIAIMLGAQNEGNIKQQQVITSGELQNEANYVYQNYVSQPNLYYMLDGKPLLIVDIGQGAGDPGWRDSRFTVRVMSATLESQFNIFSNQRANTWWTWYDRDPMPSYNNGVAEALTVTQAYAGNTGWTDSNQIPSWDPRPVHGRNTGVFTTQWNKAVSYNPQIIIINQWNEFMGGSISPGADELTPNLSNDIEPSVELGCGPMTTVQQAIARWKGVSLPAISCPPIPALTAAQQRDAQRTSDMDNVAAALGRYKEASAQYLKNARLSGNGYYPVSIPPSTTWRTVCTNGANKTAWTTNGNSPNEYIPYLASQYISALPTDPLNCQDQGAFHGYLYESNGYDYKFLIDAAAETGCGGGETIDPPRSQYNSPGHYFCSIYTFGAANW